MVALRPFVSEHHGMRSDGPRSRTPTREADHVPRLAIEWHPNKGESGMGARRYLTCAAFVALLFWGPEVSAGAAGWLVRTGYLIVVPAAMWMVLRWLWNRWRPTEVAESRLERTLAVTTAGVLLVAAFLSASSKHHLSCTQVVQTRDGTECVGDYVPAAGPDLAKALMLAIAGGAALWLGVRGRGRAPRA